DYDSGGAWARSGRANPQLLAVLLDEAYFGLPHPKSTGRELFNLGWLKQKLARLAAVPAPEDVQATLLELTAQTICDQILKLLSDGEVIVCGGGARNSALIESLQSKLGGVAVKTASDYGIDADSVEAIAFAW